MLIGAVMERKSWAEADPVAGGHGSVASRQPFLTKKGAEATLRGTGSTQHTRPDDGGNYD